MKKDKPRLIWLHTHICYWTGGTKFILNVVSNLSKHYQITVYVEDYDIKIKKEFEQGGVTVVQIAPYSSNRLYYWLFLPLIVVREIVLLKKILSKDDTIISSMFPMNIVANYLSRKKHIQFIFEPFAFFHDKQMIDGYDQPVRSLLKILRFIYGPVDIRYTRISRKIMTVNSGVIKWIKEIYNKKASPSYLILDSEKFKPVVDRYLSDKFKGKNIVLHTTDFTPLKRTDVIIKAFSKLVVDIPNAYLLIISPVDYPPRRREYEKLVRKLNIQENVSFEGFVENRMLPAYYSLAKCAVYPGTGSGASACSYFVLEVMSCGTPVVRTSDSSEEVINNESGYLFAPYDEKSLIRDITKLLKNPNQAKKMGLKARQRIEKVYTVENVIRNFNSVINSVK